MGLTPAQKGSAYAKALGCAYSHLRDEATTEKVKALAQQLNLVPLRFAYQRNALTDSFYQQVCGKMKDFLLQPAIKDSLFLNENTIENWMYLQFFEACERAVNEAYPNEEILPDLAWYTTARVYEAIRVAGIISHTVFTHIIANLQ